MRRLALVLPVLLLPLPACTGDGGDGPSLQEQRESYLEAAEAVCAEANEQAAALPQPTSVAEVPELADQVVTIVRDTVRDVTAIEPPAQDRAELTAKVLDPLRADVTAAEAFAEQLRAAAQAGDDAALLRLSGQVPTTSADVQFMRDYGFVECVEAAEQSG